MADLLTHLIFASVHSAQLTNDTAQDQRHRSDDQHAMLLPTCFLQHFLFPCKAEAVHAELFVADGDASHHIQVDQPHTINHCFTVLHAKRDAPCSALAAVTAALTLTHTLVAPELPCSALFPPCKDDAG